MDAQGYSLVIGATAAGIALIITTIATAYTAFVQAPRQAQKTDEVHKLVNDKSDRQEERIAGLEETIRDLRGAALGKSDEALTKSEARERP